jgi:peptidoglycan/LPS O-acetylase OafA/YrhL
VNVSARTDGVPEQRLPERLLALDLLRFLAVCLVLFRHSLVRGPVDSPGPMILGFIQRGGWVGVDLFFVLSGFLVSGLLFNEYRERGTVDVKRFLIRRGWRIYPLFWVMIGFSLLLKQFAFLTGYFWTGFSWPRLWGELFFLQNYCGRLWAHTWTLAVEEHFYLLLPLVVWLFCRLRKRWPDRLPGASPAVFVLFGLLAAGCLWGRHLAWQHTADKYRVLYPTHLRMDSLAFGVMLSYAWHLNPRERFRAWVRRWRFVLLGVAAAGLIPSFVWEISQEPWMMIYGPTIFYLGCGMLLLGFLSFDGLDRIAGLKHAGKLGSYSYSVYLWHGPFVFFVMDTAREHLAWGNATEWITIFVGSWALGIASAKLLEKPVLKLRDRYFPSLSASDQSSKRAAAVTPPLAVSAVRV